MQDIKAALTIGPPLDSLNLAARAPEATIAITAPKQPPQTRAATNLAAHGICAPNLVFNP